MSRSLNVYNGKYKISEKQVTVFFHVNNLQKKKTNE